MAVTLAPVLLSGNPTEEEPGGPPQSMGLPKSDMLKETDRTSGVFK